MTQSGEAYYVEELQRTRRMVLSLEARNAALVEALGSTTITLTLSLAQNSIGYAQRHVRNARYVIDAALAAEERAAKAATGGGK